MHPAFASSGGAAVPIWFVTAQSHARLREQLDAECTANRDYDHRSVVVRDALHELYLGRPYQEPEIANGLAQQSLVTARMERLQNLVTLYQALGGGWIEHTGEQPRPADAPVDYGAASAPVAASAPNAG